MKHTPRRHSRARPRASPVGSPQRSPRRQRHRPSRRTGSTAPATDGAGDDRAGRPPSRRRRTDDRRTPTTTAAPTTLATTTTDAGRALQPLTGVAVEAPATYTPRPALVVKIDNVDAEPQSGLNQADIVYEEIVEGGPRGSPPCSTRWTPIRSGRSAPGARRTSTCSPTSTIRSSCGPAATPA